MLFHTSELMTVETFFTNKVRYFVKKCDTFQRVSKEDYDSRYQTADGLICLSTKSSNTHRRSYRTLTYEVKTNDS